MRQPGWQTTKTQIGAKTAADSAATTGGEETVSDCREEDG